MLLNSFSPLFFIVVSCSSFVESNNVTVLCFCICFFSIRDYSTLHCGKLWLFHCFDTSPTLSSKKKLMIIWLCYDFSFGDCYKSCLNKVYIFLFYLLEGLWSKKEQWSGTLIIEFYLLCSATCPVSCLYRSIIY